MNDSHNLRTIFKSRLNHLQSVNLGHLEDYFLGVPFDNLSSSIDIVNAYQMLDTLVDVAKETGFDNLKDLRLCDKPTNRLLTDSEKVQALFGWLGPTLGLNKDKKSLDAIVNANGHFLPSYLLVNSTWQWQEMAKAYCPFIEKLHQQEDPFVIYIARDAASLFEVDTYLAQLKGEKKRAGLIYRSGLKIDYQSFDTTNQVLTEIMKTVSAKFLEEDEESFRYKHYSFGDGIKQEGVTNLKLKSEYQSISDDEVYLLFEFDVVQAIAAELNKNNLSDFYKQSREYFEQMKRTGVFNSKGQKVKFVDTGGTGKTLLYSKAVFDYFSKLEEVELASSVLMIERYQNYTNQGQTDIPGFPSIIDNTRSNKNKIKQYNLPIGIEILARESDIQPFYAADVIDGNVQIRSNPLSIQLLCLVRSIINWNEAVAYHHKL